MSFSKHIGKSIGKNIGKNLSVKYSQKILDHCKQFATDAIKTVSKKAIKKKAKATGDFIGNKIAEAVAKLYNGRITKVSKTSPRNSLELKMSMIKKYLKKDRYLQKKDRKLLMI